MATGCSEGYGGVQVGWIRSVGLQRRRLKGRELGESACGRWGGSGDRYGLSKKGPCENPIIPICLFYAYRRRVRYYRGDSRS